MSDKPISYTPFADWIFHTAHGDHKFVQSGAPLFDPQNDVLKFIKEVDKLITTPTITLDELEKLEFRCLPYDTTVYKLDRLTNPRVAVNYGPYDFAQVCHLLWTELHYVADFNNRVRGHKSKNANLTPGYRWQVWRDTPDAKQLELSFVMYDNAGKVEAMFDIPRCNAERFEELLSAPHMFARLLQIG